MLNARVLSLGVLADDDRVDTVVSRLVTDDGTAGSNVGVEVESATEGQVEGDVTLANCRRSMATVSIRRLSLCCSAQHALGVARGPLSAIVFFLIDLIAFSGMVETPSTRTGVTSTSSHVMGT